MAIAKPLVLHTNASKTKQKVDDGLGFCVVNQEKWFKRKSK